ncbi:MAG TPA: polysaccharide deacetylase family protein [Ruminiclostridium sp.]|nr:polysaccharide deacetylase family protein [Ruminiclostridium sp.]
MSYEFYYPQGKKKALTFSYDDGQVFDRRLVEIFNKYDMKATFHLNSGTLGTDGFVTKKEVKSLYKGHEVSCHSVTHPYLTKLSKEQLVEEIREDRRQLETETGYPVRGMSYPFGEYDADVEKALSVLGIEYSRTVNSTSGFHTPGNFLEWHPTCHHNGEKENKLSDLLESFQNPPPWVKLPLFYIWGHSYEFYRENNWEVIEDFCKAAAHNPDVWYATNIEIKEYICALKSLILSVDQTMVYNPGAVSVWLARAGESAVELRAGQSLTFK